MPNGQFPIKFIFYPSHKAFSMEMTRKVAVIGSGVSGSLSFGA